MKRAILFFDNFDPINKKQIDLLQYASNYLQIFDLFLNYYDFNQEPEIFKKEEKILLINMSIASKFDSGLVIDGDSFINKGLTLIEKILQFKKDNQKVDTYLLITSAQYQKIKHIENFNFLFSVVKVVFYVYEEHQELLDEFDLAKSKIQILPFKKTIKNIDASIHQIEENDFTPEVIACINHSSECAVKRIKKMLSPERFKHSIQVASTAKKIMELAKLDDQILGYLVYMSAMYHDICKELPNFQQKKIAKEHLKIKELPNVKLLHGPVATWYMKKYFLFDNEEIFYAIKHHTVPCENPNLLLKILFLSDRLELDKKGDFDAEEYLNYWRMIEETKIDEVFDLLIKRNHEKHGKTVIEYFE